MNVPERLALELAKPMRIVARGVGRLTRRGLLPAALVCFGLGGCASLWDDITSRDFEMRSLWVKPDPLVVLKDSKDGDKRARALRAMPEPAQFGESQEKQDEYVMILCTAVKTERTALCRQAALASLRTYKDPRVSKAIQEGYWAASTYAADTAAILRCQALEALGQVGNPDSLELLIKVVKAPPLSKNDDEHQHTMALQERIAAARALGHFKNIQAAETLVEVLKTDKDPGMRNVAQTSLQMETNKRFPEDAVVWEQFIHSKEDKDAIFNEGPSLSDQIQDIVNVAWWWN